MRILAPTDYFYPAWKAGGPIQSLKNFLEHANDEFSIHVICNDRDLGDSKPFPNKSKIMNASNGSKVTYIPKNAFKKIKILYWTFRYDYDVLYLNSFFSLNYTILPLFIAYLRSIPVVLGIRGEFSDVALTKSSIRKKIYVTIFKFFYNSKLITIQASTKFESIQIKKVLGENYTIMIAEDITYVPQFPRIPKSRPPFRMVTVGRVVPIKNIELSIEILALVNETIEFDIYGPIENLKYFEYCKNIASKAPGNLKINFKGGIPNHEILKTLVEYDGFLFLSKSENYGHVVFEAAAAGLPLIISNRTPWKNLDKLGIGWEVALNDKQYLREKIEELVCLNSETRYKLRKHVQNWALNNISIEKKLADHETLFQSALNKTRV